MGWVVFGISYSTQPGLKITAQPVSLLLPTALLIVLDIMLWHCQAILKQMHVLSTYLAMTESSVWERHYQAFSDKGYSIQEDLTLFIFLTLGLLSAVIPIAVNQLFPPAESYPLGMIQAIFYLAIASSGLVWLLFWKNKDFKKYRKDLSIYWYEVLTPPGPLDSASGKRERGRRQRWRWP
jgi:hypothetical protein